jgi:RHS repeat-associated protein
VSANSGVGLNSFTPVSPSNFNAKNQVALQGATYDLAGNQAAIGGYVLGYDGEGRLAKSTLSGVTTVYEYDGEGRRVKRGGVVLVYDAQGRLSAEYGGTGQSGVRYLTGDHLGSTRVVTDGSGTVEQCLDYLPFGELLGAGLNGRTCGALEEPRAKFTGKERDAETGLDYFGARYFSGAQGRFTSPDPIWVKADRMLDPQRLNLYAYGRNNPLKYSDPTGMDVVLGTCASNMTISMCQAAATNGLSKEERSHVRWVQGDGKNGFKKGQWGLQVDSNYKSSKNFANLQTAANSKDGTAVINVVAPHSAIPTLVGVQQGGQTAMQPFKDYIAKQLAGTGVKPGENYVSGAEEAFGQTLFPAAGATAIPDVLYAPGSNTQMYLAADNSPTELTATFFHELVHIVLGDFGRTIPKSGHGFGTVSQQTKAAEDAARANYGK